MKISLSHKTVRAVTTALTVSLASLSLTGCDHLDQGQEFHAGNELLRPAERHPIVVTQQPSRMSLRVGRGAAGLTPAQKAQLIDFLSRYHASDSGNSKLVINVPSGSSNEVAAMNAVADMRPILADQGISESTVSIEPYHSDGEAQPPIRVSYLRFTAQGPECGKWTDNLGVTARNLNYNNFGCAYQKNIAAMASNPADLLGPRTMTPASADRRDVVYDKYVKDQPTGRIRTQEERAVKQ